MTIFKFLREIKRLNVQWETIHYGSVTYLRMVIDGEHFCPINGLCYLKNKKKYIGMQYRQAATDMGLSRFWADQIAEAVDTSPSFTRTFCNLIIFKFLKWHLKGLK